MGDSAENSELEEMVSDRDLLAGGMNRLVLSYKREIAELGNDYNRLLETFR